MKAAYTHGRYQPLHLGHFKLFLKILERYDQLWIGITNPLRRLPDCIDEMEPALQASVRKAREPDNNPYSYTERQEMIIRSFMAEGVDLKRVRVMPHLGYYDDPEWQELMPDPKETVIVLAAKDKHHDEKIKVYEDKGYRVEVMPQIPGFSGKAFDKEFPDGNWKDLVPKGTIGIIEKSSQPRI